MEKISGILPANSRTKSTDTAQSQPIRPGAPSLGRPVGRVTRAQMDSQSQSDAENLDPVDDKLSLGQKEMNKLSTYKPNPEAAKLKMIDELNAKFNLKNLKQSSRESDLTKSEEYTENLQV